MRSLMNAWNGSPFGLSVAQITDIINHQNVAPKIVPRFKLVDMHSLQERNTGAFGPYGDAGDISSGVLTGSLSNDTTSTSIPPASSPRTLDTTFHEGAFSYDPLQDALQVFLDYFDSSTGALQFEVPLGVFPFVIADKTIADSGITCQALMADVTGLLDMPFLNSYVLPVGITYVQAMIQILTLPTLPASLFGGGGSTLAGADIVGAGFPASRISIPDNGILTPATIAFTRDQTLREALDILAAAINYYPIAADGMGTIVSSARPDLSKMPLPVPTWSFITDESSIIHPGISWQTPSKGDLANICCVYSENTQTAAFSSTKYNSGNNGSSISLSVLGYALPPRMIKDDTIPDQANCDLRCYVELTTAALLGELISFRTWPQPFLTDSHERYFLTINDKNGDPLISNAIGFEETSWKMDLIARTHQHVCGQLVII